MDNGLAYFVRSAQRGEEVSSEHVLVFFVRFFFVVWWWWSLACQGSVSSSVHLSSFLLVFLANVVQGCCGASVFEVTCWFLPSVPSVAVLLQEQCFLRCGGTVQAWLLVWYCCLGKAFQRFMRSSMWNQRVLATLSLLASLRTNMRLMPAVAIHGRGSFNSATNVVGGQGTAT